jgi:hypothetical protein
MKRITVLINFLICVLVLGSCRKDALTSQLMGSWELRILYGGQVAGSGPNYSPGNGDIWKFTDSAYNRYVNGQLTGSGGYSLIKANTFDIGVPEDALILDGDSTFKIHFSITRDTLTTYVGSIPADGYIAKYVRLSNYRQQ